MRTSLINNYGTITFENSNPIINTDGEGNIIILDDISFPINGMNKENIVSIYIAQYNNSINSDIIYYKIEDEIREKIILDPRDGFITFCHIILPNEDYFNSHPELIYYSKNSKIYKRVEESDEEVDPLELVDYNNPPFVKHFHNFFSIYHLRKCYVSLCQKIFNNRGFDKCFNTKVDSLLIYKRDLVWAALNVIQYMIDSNQLAEALRLLERINGCNGLCASENTGDKNCGCK